MYFIVQTVYLMSFKSTFLVVYPQDKVSRGCDHQTMLYQRTIINSVSQSVVCDRCCQGSTNQKMYFL